MTKKARAAVVKLHVGDLSRERRQKLLKDLEAAKREYERAKRTAAWKKRIGQQLSSPIEGLQQDYRLRYTAIGIAHRVVLPPLRFE